MVKETLWGEGGGNKNEISTKYTSALRIISSSYQVQDISKLLSADPKTFFFLCRATGTLKLHRRIYEIPSMDVTTKLQRHTDVFVETVPIPKTSAVRFQGPK